VLFREAVLIVNIAGWVYIIHAALGLWSLTAGPFGLRMSLVNLVALLASALSGLIGYGLLKRDPRARWWALGSSLISWVVGGLLIVVGIAALIFAMFADVGSGSSGGSLDLVKMMFAGAAVLAFFLFAVAAAIFIAITVIFYKLFWYLCSREGCAEFGVEYGSAGTVLASVGAWIVVGIAQYFVTSSGLTGLLLQQAMSRDSGRSHESVSDLEREAARQQTRTALEREEERQRAVMLEEAQQALAQSQADERLRGDALPETHSSVPEYTPPDADDDSAPPDSEAPVPVFGRTDDADDEDDKKTNKILKCRDSSGAVSYTQGYCPPGTTLVDTPKFE
jgi:signal transduction histidine kinase